MFKLMLVFLLSMNLSVHAQSDFTKAEAVVMKADALRLWQKRDDQQSLEEALSKFEHVLSTNPQDLEILTYLARGYFLLADLHLDNEDLRMKNYEKAKSFGEQGLEINPEYKKEEDKDIEKAISKVTDKKEIPIMFWTAAALGKWAKLNGIMSSMKYKGQILAMIRQVEKVWPDFYYGAVPRYWGGFYAVAPRIAGGNMDKSKKNFKKAIEVAPEYLGSRVLYAELYWTEKENRKAFEEELKAVLAAPNGPEDIRPENMLEKRKAQKLLDKADKYF